MPVEKRVVDEQLRALGHFSRFFTRKEIKYLPEVLSEGETIRGFTSGACDENTWLIVVTDRRLLFLDKGLIYGLKQMELPLHQISAISHETGLVFGEVHVSTAGGTKKINRVPKKDVLKIAQIMSDLLKPASRTQEPAPAGDNADDVVSQLERLAALKEKGVLTEEEFQAQKAKLLAE